MYADPADVAQRNEETAINLARRVITEAKRPQPRPKLCLAVKRARIRTLLAEALRAMRK